MADVHRIVDLYELKSYKKVGSSLNYVGEFRQRIWPLTQGDFFIESYSPFTFPNTLISSIFVSG